MSRLELNNPQKAQSVLDQMYLEMERRLAAAPSGVCPVDVALSCLNVCRVQTCGKCSPCRIGLTKLAEMMEQVLEGKGGAALVDQIEKTAQTIVDTADCAVGIDAAQMILTCVRGFREDFLAHAEEHTCLTVKYTAVPCVSRCPAHVDIPGYVALVKAGRYNDAVKLIRKDNPFPTACAYICEHPCELDCRRNMVDSAVNIRGLKRYAVEYSRNPAQPKCAEPTGKTVAVIGGGPGGLTAAYYLALMGHKVTVYDQRKQLGGMMRYGIPSYRFPREKLDGEIRSILSLGIEVKTEVAVGKDIKLKELRKKYDAVFISIGAHTDKKVGIEGEDSKGVMSAVEMLRAIGDGEKPDFRGKNVVVIGGGNVAMDVTRSAVRLGAKHVTCVYRRRQEDMTAQQEEVEGAIAEGAEVMTLHAPLKIEADKNGQAVALWAQPQIIGEMDKAGRPRPNPAKAEPVRLAADLVLVAIGQNIDSEKFGKEGVKIGRGDSIVAGADTRVPEMDGVFAGGDCVTGPATVIRAIAAGKTAAANIDQYLGFAHEITTDVKVPVAESLDIHPCGRVNPTERKASERKKDFKCMEYAMTAEEAAQESSRCLRCDHFGYGSFREGRVDKW